MTNDTSSFFIVATLKNSSNGKASTFISFFLWSCLQSQWQILRSFTSNSRCTTNVFRTWNKQLLVFYFLQSISMLKTNPFYFCISFNYILLLGFLAYLLWLLVFIVNLLQTRTTWEESLNERLSDQAGSWKELHGIAVTILTDMGRTTHKWAAPLSNLGY